MLASLNDRRGFSDVILSPPQSIQEEHLHTLWWGFQLFRNINIHPSYPCLLTSAWLTPGLNGRWNNSRNDPRCALVFHGVAGSEMEVPPYNHGEMISTSDVCWRVSYGRGPVELFSSIFWIAADMLQTNNYSLVLLIQLALLTFDLFVNSFSETAAGCAGHTARALHVSASQISPQVTLFIESIWFVQY